MLIVLGILGGLYMGIEKYNNDFPQITQSGLKKIWTVFAGYYAMFYVLWHITTIFIITLLLMGAHASMRNPRELIESEGDEENKVTGV